MNTEKIFSLLKEMTQRYEVIPFLEKEDGTLIYQKILLKEKKK